MKELFLIFNYKCLKPAQKQIWGRFLFCILLLNIFLFKTNIVQVHAQGPKLKHGYYIIKDLNESWLVFDEQYKEFVPYLITRHFNYQSFSQNFDLENYRGYKLFLYSANDSYLFYNGIYQKRLIKNNWNQFDIDSIYNSNSRNSNILLTIYTKEKTSIENFQLFIAHNSKLTVFLGSKNDNRAALKIRKFSVFKNFTILFSLLIFSFFAFLYNFQNSILLKYLNIKDLFTIGKRFDSIIVNRPFDIGNILYMIVLSLTIALILIIFEYNFLQILPNQILSIENPSFINLTGQLINLGFLTFLAFLLKYFFISIISDLYQLGKIKNIHFFKNIQSTGIFTCLIILLLCLFLFFPNATVQFNKLIYIIFGGVYFSLRLFLLFFVILKAISVKNLYLFSYLCIVELIPLFVIIRLLL